MKVLLREYLAALKERDELDAIFPDLLSELGYNVFSFPQRGTSQRGVDVAAEGVDDDGVRKVFLFSLKQGDLTRQDWDGTPQALRPSLNEIQDIYIPNRLPSEFHGLPVVICLVFGGVVQEQVREHLTSHTTKNSSAKLTFRIWNGDVLAGLLLKGLLREELLPAALRSMFQKAIALVDEPHASIGHFRLLASALHKSANLTKKDRLRSARQLNICLWVLFVWARESGNLESPFQASEIVLLVVWDLMREHIDKSDAVAGAMTRLLAEVIHLHIAILGELVDKKLVPHVGVKHGLTKAVASHKAVDANLALFDILGRISMMGIWAAWLESRMTEPPNDPRREAMRNAAHGFVSAGVALIESNPLLLLPITDHQATDIALFLLLWLVTSTVVRGLAPWLVSMAENLYYTVHTHGLYPCTSGDYRDLAGHPREKTDEYLKEMTSGSTFIPLLGAWLSAVGEDETFQLLATLMKEKLDHCTLQFWFPDKQSDEKFLVQDHHHGRALCDLSLGEGGAALLDTIADACRMDGAFKELSAMATGYWPIVLLACRHHRLPIPPQFWIYAFRKPEEQEGETVAGGPQEKDR